MGKTELTQNLYIFWIVFMDYLLQKSYGSLNPQKYTLVIESDLANLWMYNKQCQNKSFGENEEEIHILENRSLITPRVIVGQSNINFLRNKFDLFTQLIWDRVDLIIV